MPTTCTDRAARLDAVLDAVVERRHLPHALAAVRAADGSWSWSGARGVSGRLDGGRVTADTPFFVASVTKLFHATVILQLVEEQRITLDQPVADLLDTPLEGLHVTGGVDRTGAITVRHLLAHTSGLPDHLEDRPRRQPSWYQELASGEDRSWTLDDAVRRARDELRPRFAPQDPAAGRQRARYSDLGYQLLIALIEQTDGGSLAGSLERRLLRPLGLRRTWLPGRSVPLDPAPSPAAVHDGSRPLHLPRAFAACYDLISTLDDTLTFLDAWRTGALFADRATADLIGGRWNRIGFPLRYGLGAMRFPVNALAAPGPRPVHLVGHSGATGSWLFHCPELGLLLSGTVDQVRGRTLPFRLMVRLLRAASPQAST